MALKKKGSRKIVVQNREFRWRATQNEQVITLVVWPVDNEDARIVGYLDPQKKLESGGQLMLIRQKVITNRLVRDLILTVGVSELLETKGQRDVGSLEEVIDVSKAIRNLRLDTIW